MILPAPLLPCALAPAVEPPEAPLDDRVPDPEPEPAAEPPETAPEAGAVPAPFDDPAFGPEPTDRPPLVLPRLPPTPRLEPPLLLSEVPPFTPPTPLTPAPIPAEVPFLLTPTSAPTLTGPTLAR